ncbi:NAD(P)-dependent oxidoreductase [Schinkia azotoformans]|uniref:NAD(P)-dependent oxidoreductase n=1 Tax=Schinkia azotoformans TaxID=1454 RepID=UPI002DBCCE97|nr:NAD(P)-dependent oxidoreductase [Schinkia azotoformans]MEC1721397.1 NAD(P)-dependent oxidoreductase [Schinkia azotoformans]MED4352545.1 NAD(P)-dependent oxidoreductase [Schinkia azotoformans]MED4414655.1 NAD(P)-dependent oxidoreductase [Schinkia azotoformans]
MKIGFIGLGNMGLPMAKNLVKANFEVVGKNRSKGKEDLFVEAGGKSGISVAEMAKELDVILTCLPLPADVEAVYFGADGLIENGHEGLILVDHSTVAPGLNKKIADVAKTKGIEFLDAPISGGNFGAEDGTLTIMVGGKKEIYEKVLPLFNVMGKNIYHIGEIGSGSVVKLINNLMVAFHTQAVSEAVTLGKRMGVDLDLLFNILNNSYAQSRIYDRHYNSFIAKDQFEAGFAIKLLHKDMKLAEEMASGANMELPIGGQLTNILKDAIENDLGEQDMSALYVLLNKKLSNLN